VRLQRKILATKPHPLIAFSFAVLGFYAVFWSARLLFPGGAAAGIVLVLATVIGLFTRPGWNIRPGQPTGYWAVLFGLLLGSTAAAVLFLKFFKIPHPYDAATLNLIALLPGILAVTAIEELLFRQVMFKWLQKRQVSSRTTVIATSVAFACAHLGGALAPIDGGRTFYILQSLYMLWIGGLLGEIRRVTDSWLTSWLGHAGYNVTVLLLFSVMN
jgi:hypothetical protein